MSDRCKLCGERVYQVWIDTEPHNNECVEGATNVMDCRQAMGLAVTRAELLKMGVLPKQKDIGP